MKDLKDDVVKEETVNCITFDELVKKHTIEKIDILQIDTEGYDYLIFKQIDLDRFKPEFIRIEICNLPKDEEDKVIDKFSKHGYHYIYDGRWDMVGILHPEKYLDNYKSTLYSSIKSMYSLKKWDELKKKCNEYLNRYTDMDNEIQFVIFYLAFSYMKLFDESKDNITRSMYKEKSINNYEKVLKVDNLDGGIKIWSTSNLLYLK